MDDAVEEWRDVPGFEGRYQASTHGRIRGTTARPPWNEVRVLRPYLVRPRPGSPCSYLKVTLIDASGRRCKRFVHRLVLLTFVGPPPDDAPDGAHANGDSHDCALSNLSWKSRLANVRESSRWTPADGMCGRWPEPATS